ncbi:MFS transporter [Vallitalea longa]|uniref:MFS transporter n=1 Tax=Vallitalea longa TaxID=2936439 RepID=A0A9W5YEG2_9FIRM|nr:MFS transporter [Vallitalea longa]GKX31025.1 MFS transporter [Vallitalea longa]
MNKIVVNNQMSNITLISLSRFISYFGDGVFFIGVNWFIYNESGSILFLSLFQAISGIPIILSIPFIGVLADRFSRKKLVISADILRCFIIVLLIVCVNFNYYIIPLFIAKVLLSLLETTYFISFSGLVVDSIKKDNLVSFNSTSTIAYQFGYLLGSASAGFIISIVGNVGVLVVDAISFILSAFSIMFVKRIVTTNEYHSIEKKDKIKYFTNIVEGLRIIRLNKVLRSIVIFSIPGPLLISLINLLEPAFISNILKGTATSLGFVDTALGIGTIFGALFIGILKKAKKENIYLWLGYILVSLGFVVFATVPTVLLAIVVNFFIGVFHSGIGIIYNSNIQYRCDKEYIGRITSFKRIIQNILATLILIVFGGIGSLLNYRYLFVILSIMTLLTGLFCYFIFRKKYKL